MTEWLNSWPSHVIDLFIGAVIGAAMQWQASKGNRRMFDTLKGIAFGLEDKGLIELTRDRNGNIIGAHTRYRHVATRVNIAAPAEVAPRPDENRPES
jgi:hypothetical protein